MSLGLIKKDLAKDIDFASDSPPPDVSYYEDFGNEKYISLPKIAVSLARLINDIPALSLISAIDQIGGWLPIVFHESCRQEFSIFKADYPGSDEIFIHKDAWHAAIDQIKDSQPGDGTFPEGKVEALNLIRRALEDTDYTTRSQLFELGVREVTSSQLLDIEKKIHPLIAQTYEDLFHMKANITFRRNERYRNFLPAAGL